MLFAFAGILLLSQKRQSGQPVPNRPGRRLARRCFALAFSLCQTFGLPAFAAEAARETAYQPAIDPIVAAMLIKSTIIAIQHANQTGNYTVLRDMGTPVFRERFDAAQLAAIFGNLRARGINLSPVLVLSPNLERPAELMDRRRLRLVGSFPTQPLQIRYELVFLQIDGVWRVDGLAVDAVVPSGAKGTASKPAIGWETKTKS